MRATPAIQDHGVIGDGRSAALINRDGDLDWLCWPRFDSPSLFAALLDRERGGTFRIAPTAAARVSRAYLDETNVLETRFETDRGAMTLTDFMPALDEETKRSMLLPEHELIRRLRCERGELEVALRFEPRPAYAAARPVLRDRKKLGLSIEHGGRLTSLHAEIPLEISASSASATFLLREGQTLSFSLTSAAEGPAVVPPLGDVAEEKLRLTAEWWRRWARRARYDGPHRAHVVRSALALKLMSFAPSGAIVAAPTTSLPERPGGDLNWDYRFCWLRDAAFTSHALFSLGYEEDAEAFVSWMLHATKLTRPELKVLYDVYGKPLPEERELPHLQGHAGSRPVRVSNATRSQLQLDVYGEVIEAVRNFVRRGGELDRETQSLLREIAGHLCRHARDPDDGIWEPREPRAHRTHSRLLSWVALDRLLQIDASHGIHRLPRDRVAGARDQIRDDIERHAWNPRIPSYTDTLGGDRVDASLLLMAVHGFERADAPRMAATHRAVRQRLGAGPGLLYRYEKSREDGEGAFVICSFWEAQFLAAGGGTPEEARAYFEDTLRHANDLRLFAEEIDPSTGDALGNFPQAFSHVGLINAALALEELDEREDRERSAHRRAA